MPETKARETESSSVLATVARDRAEQSEIAPGFECREQPSKSVATSYEALRKIVRNELLPLAIVDLDRFDDNVRQFAKCAAAAGKTIRVASKSIRVPELLRRAFSLGGSALRGVMCYSAQEVGCLAEQGFDDFLVGYPTCQAQDVAVLQRATQAGKKTTLVVDSPQQVERLADVWRDLGGEHPLHVCVEADISWRPCGWHIGAQRSPLRSLHDVGQVLDCIARRPELQLTGSMTYEAHLAGLPDYKPLSPLRNFAVRGMKAWARRDVARQRRRLAEYLQTRGITLELINGGGTGSFQDALRDPWLGEVTVGSGFLQPHLFDGYQDALGQSALFFALGVTRSSQRDRVTCQSGGFIASGAPGKDRLPSPFLPAGLQVDPWEGCGEVQTPLIVPRAWQGRLNIGDPIFFRPAKAGELAEHFGEYLVLQGGCIVDRIKTYRGMGLCFH